MITGMHNGFHKHYFLFPTSTTHNALCFFKSRYKMKIIQGIGGITKMEVINMDVPTLVSSIGFPITACIGLAYFCKIMIDRNNDNLGRLFDIYDKANTENREAIRACTEAINKLCDRLEDSDK